MLLLGWGTRTSSISPSLSSLSITGAFALYGILITVLEGASPVVMGGIAVASPIICGGLLLLPTECTIYDGNWKRITAKHLTSPPWGVLCLLLLCSIACAATEVVVAPSQEASRLFTSNALRLPVFLLVFVVNFLWAIPLSHDNPDQLWGPLFVPDFLRPAGLLVILLHRSAHFRQLYERHTGLPHDIRLDFCFRTRLSRIPTENNDIWNWSRPLHADKYTVRYTPPTIPCHEPRCQQNVCCSTLVLHGNTSNRLYVLSCITKTAEKYSSQRRIRDSIRKARYGRLCLVGGLIRIVWTRNRSS